MARDIKTEFGVITLADEILATIAGVAATECHGIAGMASRKLQDGLAELLGRESLSRGVEVHMDGERLVIDLHIVVSYGTSISEVARDVRESVRRKVEELSGLQVAKVNVLVQGVRIN